MARRKASAPSRWGTAAEPAAPSPKRPRFGRAAPADLSLPLAEALLADCVPLRTVPWSAAPANLSGTSLLLDVTRDEHGRATDADASSHAHFLAMIPSEAPAPCALAVPLSVAEALCSLTAAGVLSAVLSSQGVTFQLLALSGEAPASAAAAALPFLLDGPPRQGACDSAALFSRLRRPAEASPALPPPSGLVPTLRPYQARAVAWMVRREKGEAVAGGHPLWRPLPGGGHFCAATGKLQAGDCPPWPEMPAGGILSDEMGLGKTVEVLALILAHKLAAEPAETASPPSPAAPPQPPYRRDRVACACGDTSEALQDCLWVQCEDCLAWNHASCVSYAPPKRRAGAASPPDEPPWRCGRCIAWHAGARHDAPCGATLVVCPQALLGQWKRELAAHAAPGALTVVSYDGQPQEGGAPGGGGAPVITAAMLAAADVVLTSYETLRADLHHDSSDDALTASGRGGRERRFHTVPTPLTRLTWWRLLCDESQLLEHGAAGAAALACRLQARHRWLVSGTPFPRGALDVQGMLAFLDALPLNDPGLWRAAVGTRLRCGDGPAAADALAACLRPLFWRSSRADVAAELALQPQSALVTRLHLSPLERHWYDSLHSRLSAEAATALGGQHAGPLRQEVLRGVRGPLLKLRQACDHPQVGASRLAGLAGGVLTMTQIRAKLRERARLEAEEAQRAMALDLNAMAGIALLRGHKAAAAGWYRQVLALGPPPGGFAVSDDSAETLRLDVLQRLHALTNLEQVLSGMADPSDSVWTAAAAKQEAGVLAEGYLAQHTAACDAAGRDLARAVEAAGPATGQHSWWVAALQRAGRSTGGGTSLINRLIDVLQDRWQDGPVPFRDCAGVTLAVASEMDKQAALLAELRALVARLTERCSAPSEEDVWASGRCFTCRRDSSFAVAGVRCLHCEAGPLLQRGENTLFGKYAQAPRHESMSLLLSTGELWRGEDRDAGRTAPSSAEALLRCLATWASRDGGGGSAEAAASRTHLEILEARRREFHKTSALVKAQRDAMGARDELAMCATRLRLVAEGETVAEQLAHSVVHPAQLEERAEWYEAERAAHAAELAAAQAQARWLAGPTDADACPICHDGLKEGAISVLPCGHSLCTRCTLRLVDRANPMGTGSGVIKCPKCRRDAPAADICTTAAAAASSAPLVEGCCPGESEAAPLSAAARELAAAAAAAEPGIKLEGQWGTKIDAVVRRLLFLSHREPGSKALVFSEWEDTFIVVEAALRANNIAFLRAGGRSGRGGGRRGAAAGVSSRRGATAAAAASAVAAFQADPAIGVLLLPIARGANGLNLTAARHVLLLEPLMDAAAEAQAVKRVDRIGQEHPTCVHRFVVTGTIEANVARVFGSRVAAQAAGGAAGEKGWNAAEVLSLLDV